MEIELTPDEVEYLEEPYTTHEIVGALNENPAGMLPKDVKWKRVWSVLDEREFPTITTRY